MSFVELEIENEMDEPAEPLHSPIPPEMSEDFSDIDCHRILSIGGKLLCVLYKFLVIIRYLGDTF